MGKFKGDVALYLSGQPVQIKACGLYVVQPKIKDIAMFGETSFLTAVSAITELEDFVKSVKEGNSELKNHEDFQVLLEIIRSPDAKAVKDDFNAFFSLCFPDYKVEYTKKTINFRLEDQDTVVGQFNPFTFKDFAEVVDNLFCNKSSQDKNKMNPANDLAKEIAEKIKKGRELAAKQRGESSPEGTLSLFGTYCSILAVGMNMDINIFFNYTPFQLYDVFNRYILKMSSDFYQRIATMPFMKTDNIEQPEEWTKNLY